MFCKLFKKKNDIKIKKTEPRENKSGEIVEEKPDLHDGDRLVRPSFPKLSRKHIYPLNTRYDDDPDKGGHIKPKGIIWHYTVTYHTDPTVRFFKRNAVDVHFVVGHKGEVVQMVPCNKRAAHAGKSKWKEFEGLNDHFLGIEFVNMGPLYPYNGKFLDCYNAEKQKKGQRFSYWEGEVLENKFDGHKWWEPLTEAQIRVGKEISLWCMEYYGFSLENVIAHHECSPGRKLDIGGTVKGGMDRIRKEIGYWHYGSGLDLR